MKRSEFGSIKSVFENTFAKKKLKRLSDTVETTTTTLPSDVTLSLCFSRFFHWWMTLQFRPIDSIAINIDVPSAVPTASPHTRGAFSDAYHHREFTVFEEPPEKLPMCLFASDVRLEEIIDDWFCISFPFSLKKYVERELRGSTVVNSIKFKIKPKGRQHSPTKSPPEVSRAVRGRLNREVVTSVSSDDDRRWSVLVQINLLRRAGGNWQFIVIRI